MHAVWRALLAALLLGGLGVGFSAPVSDASPQSFRPVSDVRGPVAEAGLGDRVYDVNDNDPDELCGSDNPRKQKKCRYNGWDNLNQNDNDDQEMYQASVLDPSATGARVTVDGLSVELWKSSESPVINTPLVIVVQGDGAAIERVSWWAEGPVYTGPYAEDLAFIGTQTYECAGVNPCVWTWPVTAKYVGTYMLHARVRDTAGREVQTDWKFETVESAR